MSRNKAASPWNQAGHPICPRVRQVKIGDGKGQSEGGVNANRIAGSYGSGAGGRRKPLIRSGPRGRNHQVEPRGPAYHSPSATTLCPPIRQTPHSWDRDPRAQIRRASWTCLEHALQRVRSANARRVRAAVAGIRGQR